MFSYGGIKHAPQQDLNATISSLFAMSVQFSLCPVYSSVYLSCPSSLKVIWSVQSGSLSLWFLWSLQSLTYPPNPSDLEVCFSDLPAWKCVSLTFQSGSVSFLSHSNIVVVVSLNHNSVLLSVLYQLFGDDLHQFYWYLLIICDKDYLNYMIPMP